MSSIQSWKEILPYLELAVGVPTWDSETWDDDFIVTIVDDFVETCDGAYKGSEERALRVNLDHEYGFLYATKQLWRFQKTDLHVLLVERCLWQAMQEDIPMELKVELAEALHTLNPYGDTP